MRIPQSGHAKLAAGHAPWRQRLQSGVTRLTAQFEQLLTR